MWRYLTGCILIVIGAYFYMIFPGMERKREIWKFRGTQWAHRGLHDKKSGIPENSMAAFREAIRANKGIELDVHLTKDKKSRSLFQGKWYVTFYLQGRKGLLSGGLHLCIKSRQRLKGSR